MDMEQEATSRPPAGRVHPRVPEGVVRRLRVARGWTQEDLAGRAGVAVRTVRNVERGRPCTVTTMKILAAAFGVDVGILLAGPISGETPQP